jgi:hypothetical protein
VRPSFLRSVRRPVPPFSFCVARSSKSISPRVMKLDRNVDQHVLCSCVFSIFRVIALDLVKTVSLCCVICSKNAWVRINQLYRNNDQHHCGAMHLGFCMWTFSVLLELLPLTRYKCAIYNLFMHSAKSIWPVGLKVYKNVGQHVYLCNFGFTCGFIQYLKSSCLLLSTWNIFCFQIVAHVAQNIFDLES